MRHAHPDRVHAARAARGGATLAALWVLLAGAPVAAQPGPPRPPAFEDYPTADLFAGRNRLVLGRADWGFRTRLREAAQQPPDFAGHYVLALWGCGAECVTGAAIDVRSGRVTWLPGDTICCWFSGVQAEARDIEPVRYSLRSRLLILNGLRHEHEGDLGQHYYAMENGRFVHLADVPAGSGPR